MIETKTTKRKQTAKAATPANPATASPSVIPAKAGTQKRLRSFDKNLCIPKTKKMDSRLRGNDRKSSGRSAPARQPHLAAAFTMVELLVALMVLILLLGITAVIYKSASDAMTQTNASVAMYQDVNALTRQIDQVMKGIYTDGYLVIYGYDVRQETDHIVERTPDGKILFDGNDLPNVRSDAICFFTTGSFNSLTNPGIAANSGWVYLGHAGAVTPDTYGSSPFIPANPSAANPLVVNQWVLSRYMLLFTPGQTGNDYRNASIGWYIKDISSDTNKLAGKNVQGVQDWFYRNWVNDFSLGGGAILWTPPAINFSNTALGAIPADFTFPYTLGNCGSFKIEFAMPASYANVLDSSSEPETLLVGGINEIVWRDSMHPLGIDPAIQSAVTINAGQPAGSPTDARISVFGPRDIWPLMIRFTLRKYDENLSITSEEDFGTNGTHQHGGQTFEYVYKLPPKN